MKFMLSVLFLFSLTVSGMAQTGLSFLKIGVGGRASGMAEAYTAVANDASATYWNPAGMVNADRSELYLSHNEWLTDVRSEFAAFILPKDSYAIGFSLNSTNISGIEIRGDQPSVEPIASFDSHDLAFGFSYARKLNRQLDVGVSLNYIYEKIYIEESGGLSGNFGLHYRFSSLPLRAALVVQNIGFMTGLKNEAPSLPHLLRFGVAYSAAFLNGNWVFAGDLVSDFGDAFHANLGVEYRLQKYLALRAGYQTGYEIKNIHFGFGLVSGRFLLDYGYVPLKQSFGRGHRLSFGILF